MLEFPFAYEKIAPTTWAYLSSLLMLALFFKFNRFWSIRNFDLILITLIAPGIILVDFGNRIEESITSSSSALSNEIERSINVDPAEEMSVESPRINVEKRHRQIRRASYYQRFGFYWLLSASLIFLIRTLADPWLLRRPLLTPNLSVGGLVFLLCSLMTFLYANILTGRPAADDLAAAESSLKMLQRRVAVEDETEQLKKHGPGLPLFQLLPMIPTFSNGQELLHTDADLVENVGRYAIASKTLAIVSQTAIVLGLVLIGAFHFSNPRIGFGMACVYLMLPYTAQYVGNVSHVLPGALLVWAVFCFRRPMISGLFVGLATGTVYYPLFLLPLWISFYWEKGVRRFVAGVIVAIVFCVVSLIFTSSDPSHFYEQLAATFGFWFPHMDGLQGIWGLGWDSIFRLPILVAFIALCISFVFWPIEKNIGTLFAYTAAVMLAVQFWHGFEGGLIMAWYMPMLIMMIFRPNTDGRDAKRELRNRPTTQAESAETLIGAN